jgi:4-amino-4-deoxy-L-arabinose transferase-like glycosyltransferase
LEGTHADITALPGDADLMTEATYPALGAGDRQWSRILNDLIERSFWRCFCAVLALMVLNAFTGLSETYVRDMDEARYGVAASEMLHTHSALVTTYAGSTEFWNLKPPLGYWLLEISFRLFGESPMSLRLPAALCALLTLAGTILLTRQIAGAAAGILAGLILVTSFGFLGHHGARSGELDSALTLILLPTLFIGPRLFDERWARLALGLLLGLGFLLKSFAILPFSAALALYAVMTRGLRSWRIWPLPILITALIALTWAFARSIAEDSWTFVYRMVSEDLLMRSTSDIDAGGNSFWDYIGCLFDRIAPWPLFVVASLLVGGAAMRRRLASDQVLLIGCFALVPLALFTLIRTHHSWYIIPTYPAWAVLASISIVGMLPRSGPSGLETTVMSAVVVAALFACEYRIVSHITEYDRLSEQQRFLQSLGNTLPRGTRLSTAFTPSYSERFFLQAVNGLVLQDMLESQPNSAARSGRSDLILFRRGKNAELDIRLDIEPQAVIAQGESYTLARIARAVGK